MNTSRSLLLFVLLGLSGCNGSGNSGNLIEVPFVQDDQFTAATATVQSLDVLANDVDSGGGALTIVSVQGSGQVVLSVVGGNRIEYQPACCSITSDQFTYTVQNSEGRRASATVRVDVQRRIQLTLRAPALANIAQASVLLGNSTQVPVTIAGNTAIATIDLRTDAQLLRADLGQSSRLVVVSALGSVPQLVSRTPASGRLDADSWAALEVSAFTSSLAGTVQAANGGAFPSLAGDFDARLAALSDWEGVTRRANYLAAVLTAGESALPSATTLFQLASDPIRTELLLENSTLTAGQRNALFPASALGGLGTNGGTFWLYRGGAHVDETAFRLELASSGAGTLVSALGRVPVSWSVQGNGLRVETPLNGTILKTGLITRRGGACEFSVPQLFERVDRVAVYRMRLSALTYSAPSAATVPDSWIASVTNGEKVYGFSLSTCMPLTDQADPGPAFPFKVRSGALVPIAAISLTPGRWLLPYFGDVLNARPLGQDLAVVSAGGSGTGPGGLSFSSNGEPDGSVTLNYPGLGSVRFYAVARFGDVYRVVVETNKGGLIRVDEAWVAKLDESVAFGAQLKNVRLRGCCRIAALRILRFDADGNAFFELSSGGLAPADVTVTGARGTLSVSLEPASEARLVIDPIATLGDGRFLTYSYIEGESTGGAEAITLEPVSP